MYAIYRLVNSKPHIVESIGGDGPKLRDLNNPPETFLQFKLAGIAQVIADELNSTAGIENLFKIKLIEDLINGN